MFVLPVAYVYPILAFLAGTYPGGTNPPWIVNGSYYLEDRSGRRPPIDLRELAIDSAREQTQQPRKRQNTLAAGVSSCVCLSLLCII